MLAILMGTHRRAEMLYLHQYTIFFVAIQFQLLTLPLQQLYEGHTYSEIQEDIVNTQPSNLNTIQTNCIALIP